MKPILKWSSLKISNTIEKLGVVLVGKMDKWGYEISTIPFKKFYKRKPYEEQ